MEVNLIDFSELETRGKKVFVRILKNDATLRYSIKTLVLQSNAILSNCPLSKGFGDSLDYS